jgi:arginase family enzyme
LLISGTLRSASEIWDPGLPAGRLFSIGGRTYSRAQRDQLRGRQRLLPLFETDLVVAARTAVLESGQAPIWVVIELDVLAAGWEPGELPPAPGGASLEALREAIGAVPGQRVVGFEVVGFPAQGQGNSLLALTGTELLRDNILTWWHHETGAT